MTYEKLDTLEQLLSCYYHQDWTDEFDDYPAAVKAMLASEPKEQIKAAVEEIDSLLAAELLEPTLGALLVDQVGCYFEPGSEGLTYKQWLGRVRNLLSER